MATFKDSPVLVILAISSAILTLIQFWNGDSNACFSLVLLISSGLVWFYGNKKWMGPQPSQQPMPQFVALEHFGKICLPQMTGNEAEIRVRRVYSSEEIDINMHLPETSLAPEAGESTVGIQESSGQGNGGQEYGDHENGNAALENRNVDDTPKDEEQTRDKGPPTSQPKSEVSEKIHEPENQDLTAKKKKLHWKVDGGSSVEVPVVTRVVSEQQSSEPGHTQVYHQNESNYQSGYKETIVAHEAGCHCHGDGCHCHCYCHCHCHFQSKYSEVQMTKEGKMEWTQQQGKIKVDIPQGFNLANLKNQMIQSEDDGCGQVTCYSTCFRKCFWKWGTGFWKRVDTYFMIIVGVLIVKILIF